MRLRSMAMMLGSLALAAAGAAAQGTAKQTTTTLVTPRDVGAGPLLPTGFAGWTEQAGAQVSAPEPKMSLVNANKNALQEDNPESSATAVYALNGRLMRVEAVRFADYSGAWSAYTTLREPGLKDAKDLGTVDAVSPEGVLFQSGATVAVAYPATVADVPALKALDAALPKVHGNQAQKPLLPVFLPAKAMVDGSVRYALGPASYAAGGGVLPATAIGWDKSGEAITAEYKDRRGDETLTLMLYPTPQIAEAHLKALSSLTAAMGGKFATAKTRREAELVMLANGTFPPEAAASFLSGIHMKQLASNDLATTGQPTMTGVIHQTASLLENIAILFGVLGLAAVLLGLFLGGGRAAIRVLQGKPASVDQEFLSLHLAPQNAPARFDQQP